MAEFSHSSLTQLPSFRPSLIQPVFPQARLNCKHCGKPVVDVRIGMQYFSEYSNVQQCPHCGNLDYHFVKPFSSYKVLEAYWQMLFLHVSSAALGPVLFLTQYRSVFLLLFWALSWFYVQVPSLGFFFMCWSMTLVLWEYLLFRVSVDQSHIYLWQVNVSVCQNCFYFLPITWRGILNKAEKDGPNMMTVSLFGPSQTISAGIKFADGQTVQEAKPN